ncbi:MULTISPECIES: DUF7344 domain-containing protein [Halolamina]|uniref:DUF7344 domain-containing protein n=1 Tax=Halolamina pelagica TaxID=699431 RepID=A0A1I5VXJ2_9EURY|nr:MULTISPECIES: hypothetical protein [Halolamina]NHX37537.1 hypothetical protein [Halolamina sp. R1-12]SFQ12209.1 hypothetical protein SAMN05216277_12120 [Halolamina pelagica]
MQHLLTKTGEHSDEQNDAYDGDHTGRDIAFTILSSRRRRNIIHALCRDEASTVSELARQLAAWETGKSLEAISSKERKRTYTALRQTHLPKLARHGVVDYDVNRGTVSLTERGRELRPYLRVPKGPAVLEYQVAFTAVLASAVVSLLSWAGVAPFTLLSGYQLAAVVTVAFSLVTLGTYLRSRTEKLERRAFRSDTDGTAENTLSADD